MLIFNGLLGFLPVEGSCVACNTLIALFEFVSETCQSNAFHCDFALCIPKRLMCDNSLHCQDGTDETFCDMGDFKSCQDIWKAGYRQTGQYIIGKEIKIFFFKHIRKKECFTSFFDTVFQILYAVINMLKMKK